MFSSHSLLFIFLCSTVHCLNLNRIYSQEVTEVKSQTETSAQFLCAPTPGCVSVPIFLWFYCCDFCISEVITCTTFPAPLWCYAGFFGWCLLHANDHEAWYFEKISGPQAPAPQPTMIAYLTCPNQVPKVQGGVESFLLATTTAAAEHYPMNWCLYEVLDEPDNGCKPTQPPAFVDGGDGSGGGTGSGGGAGSQEPPPAAVVWALYYYESGKYMCVCYKFRGGLQWQYDVNAIGTYVMRESTAPDTPKAIEYGCSP